MPTLSSPEPPPAMEGENLEDGELEDGEIDEEVDEGPPQLSPQMPTEQQSHSDSDTEIEGEEKEKEKPPGMYGNAAMKSTTYSYTYK